MNTPEQQLAEVICEGDDEVGECPHCALPFTRCDCRIDDDACWDCLKPFAECACDRRAS